MTEFQIADIERLPEAAARFIDNLRPGRVYAFCGPMGAGKTTFIAEVCRQLGTADDTNSPTFSIVNEYDTERAGKVFHLDCYRFESDEDAVEVGVEDYLYSGAVCFVEWPERIAGLLPDDTAVVRISVADDGSRLIQVDED